MRSLAASTFPRHTRHCGGRSRRGHRTGCQVVLARRSASPFYRLSPLTIVYTFEGGMKAVIWTDVAQSFFISASAITFFFLLHRSPAAGMKSRKSPLFWPQASALRFFVRLATKYTFWSGLIAARFSRWLVMARTKPSCSACSPQKTSATAAPALIASGFIVLFQFTLSSSSAFFLFVFSQHTPLLAAGHAPLTPSCPHSRARNAHRPRGILARFDSRVAMSNASGSLNSLAASTVLDFPPQWPFNRSRKISSSLRAV